MSEHNDGGPAFPALINWSDTRTGEPVPVGMTLRDWFAGQALAAIIAADGAQYFAKAADHAHWAYQQADAMLAARTALEKNNG